MHGQQNIKQWFPCCLRCCIFYSQQTEYEAVRTSITGRRNADQTKGYITLRPIYISDHISLSSSYNEKCFRQKLYRISKQTFCVQWLFSENRAVYKIMWKNIVEWGRPQMTVWRMHIACWIPKATNTHLQYVILIAFPLQNWLHERALLFRYMYIVCLAYNWELCLLRGTNWMFK